jgi:hypothetical protein
VDPEIKVVAALLHCPFPEIKPDPYLEDCGLFFFINVEVELERRTIRPRQMEERPRRGRRVSPLNHSGNIADADCHNWRGQIVRLTELRVFLGRSRSQSI